MAAVDPLKTSKVQTRTRSALLILPIILGAIWYGSYALLGLLILAGVRSAYELFRMAKRSAIGAIIFIIGAVYIGIAMALCYHLRDVYGVYLTLMFFFSMWGSDIGAYFSGKFIGGSKMSSAISPNKTWAGYGGALLAPAAVLMLFSFNVSLDILIVGVAMGIAGQAGDLLVSWLKRDVDIKNTGALIPGHGGLLDRIDSLIPAIAIFLAALKYGAL